MHKRVPLKAVQAFEAAARLSSFAAAAKELFVTPSAISHQIRLLEEQSGVQLFHRVHRAVILTDAGQRYAEKVSNAFSRIERATRDLGQTPKSDILTINSPPSFATQWLMPRLARFSALHPDTDVRLYASFPPAPDLLAQGVDIDIQYGMHRVQAVGTVSMPMPPETIVPLCSPQLLRRGHPIRKIEDLRHHPLIHSERCLISWQDWLRHHRRTRANIDTSRGPRFDRSFMSVSAAVDGLGVCLESLLLVERELDTGQLVAPLGLNGPTIQGYTFNLLRSRAELPKICRFQQWLFDELGAGGLSGRNTPASS